MAKVRTLVKRIAQELLDKYPDNYSSDFKSNKEFVDQYTNINTIKLRNRVAGYITRLANTESAEAQEPEGKLRDL